MRQSVQSLPGLETCSRPDGSCRSQAIQEKPPGRTCLICTRGRSRHLRSFSHLLDGEPIGQPFALRSSRMTSSSTNTAHHRGHPGRSSLEHDNFNRPIRACHRSNTDMGSVIGGGIEPDLLRGVHSCGAQGSAVAPKARTRRLFPSRLLAHALSRSAFSPTNPDQHSLLLVPASPRSPFASFAPLVQRSSPLFFTSSCFCCRADHSSLSWPRSCSNGRCKLWSNRA
jgi:hypothetical protein